MGAILTAGNRYDAPLLPELLDGIIIPTAKATRSRPNKVVADKAYTGKPVLYYLQSRGNKAVIPEK